MSRLHHFGRLDSVISRRPRPRSTRATAPLRMRARWSSALSRLAPIWAPTERNDLRWPHTALTSGIDLTAPIARERFGAEIWPRNRRSPNEDPNVHMETRKAYAEPPANRRLDHGFSDSRPRRSAGRPRLGAAPRGATPLRSRSRWARSRGRSTRLASSTGTRGPAIAGGRRWIASCRRTETTTTALGRLWVSPFE